MDNRPIWRDGRLVAFADATVSVLAHAMQRGSLVFDVLSLHPTARGPAIFRLREHVARFVRSTQLIGMSLAWDADALEAAAKETVRASGATSGLVRMSAFFGGVEPDLVPARDAASVAIAAYTAADVAANGAYHPKPSTFRVTIPRDVRKAGPEVFPPEAKVAAAYLGPMLARKRALAAGFDEVVLLDREGNVAEAPTENVFAVVGGELLTPPLGRILHGITRDSVLAIARDEGIAVKEAHVSPEALAGADEAFLTATSLPIGPIVAVDGRSVGEGRLGAVTGRIKARLEAAERGEDALSERFLAYV